MKRSLKVRGIVSSILLAMFLVACSGGGGSAGGGNGGDEGPTPSDVPVSTTVTPEEGGSLTSSDDKVTISVPPGAISEGVEVSIEPVDTENGLKYDLEPDGMEFDEPVTISLTVLADDLGGLPAGASSMTDSEDNAIDPEDIVPVYPVILENSDGSIEELDNVTYSRQSDGSLLITGELTHFSSVLQVQLTGGLWAGINVGGGKEQNVGTNFPVHLVIMPDGLAPQSTEISNRVTLIQMQRLAYLSDLVTGHPGHSADVLSVVATPASETRTDSYDSGNNGGIFRIAAPQFSCDQQGKGVATIEMTYFYELSGIVSGSPPEARIRTFWMNAPVECTTGATPSPTPGPGAAGMVDFLGTWIDDSLGLIALSRSDLSEVTDIYTFIDSDSSQITYFGYTDPCFTQYQIEEETTLEDGSVELVVQSTGTLDDLEDCENQRLKAIEIEAMGSPRNNEEGLPRIILKEDDGKTTMTFPDYESPYQVTLRKISNDIPGDEVMTRDQYKSWIEALVGAQCFGENGDVSVAEILGFDEATYCGARTPVDITQIAHSAPAIGVQSVANDHTTIQEHIIILTPIAQDNVDRLFNDSEFPCGDGPNGYTICPTLVNDVPAGDFIVLFNVVEEPIPLDDPINWYEYGFVFDSDGVASNNYEPSEEYANDFFKDTDRWYVAYSTPGEGWDMEVMVENFELVDSNARIIISGNVIVLVAPASEFPVEDPSFRITVFRYTGNYGMDESHDWDGSLWPAVEDGLQPFPQ